MSLSLALKPAPSSPRTLRVGSVSYLNAKPLIHGLDRDSRIDLQLAVPAMLLDGLRCGDYDVALLPVIDYQRIDDAVIVPSGGIGSDGASLTVRIFSKTPLEKITTLACDIESHTSVALARIILAERFGIRPQFVELADLSQSADAMLLIGDKVVLNPPKGLHYELDLGDAWKDLTAKPFVFAVWTARTRSKLGDLPALLTEAKERGLADLPAIVAQHAVPRGWPENLALKYLSVHLKYEVGPAHLDAIRLFHELAAKHALIPAIRPLNLHSK